MSYLELQRFTFCDIGIQWKRQQEKIIVLKDRFLNIEDDIKNSANGSKQRTRISRSSERVRTAIDDSF